MFEKCFCFFEQEGVFYDFRVVKIMKRNKKIFNLSYWTGLYDQNFRIYDPFYIAGHTGPMVTRYRGRLSQLPVVEMNSEEKTWGPEQLLFSIQFLNLKSWMTLWHQFAAVEQS